MPYLNLLNGQIKPIPDEITVGVWSPDPIPHTMTETFTPSDEDWEKALPSWMLDRGAVHATEDEVAKLGKDAKAGAWVTIDKQPIRLEDVKSTDQKLVRNYYVDDPANRDWLKVVPRIRLAEKGWVTIDEQPVFIGGPGQGAGGAGAPSPRDNVKRMMPRSNFDELDIPESGLPGARTKPFHEKIEEIAYNPQTGDLVAGRDFHAHLIGKHLPDTHFDDYVKCLHKSWLETPTVKIYADRIGDVIRLGWREGQSKAWDAAYDTMEALAKAGFGPDTQIELVLPGPGDAWTTTTLGESI